MKKLAFLTVLVLVSGCSTFMGPKPVRTGQYADTLDDGAGFRINYLIQIPEAYNMSSKTWPLILFLHGAGERGDNLELVKKHGPPKLAENGQFNYPFIVVSPQCPKNDKWTSEHQIMKLDILLDHIISRYRIDTDRIYLTGLSMGGFGTWSLGAKYPERFAALAPICGGGDPAWAEQLKNIPIWVFHGAKDSVVPVKRSKEMVEAIRKAGGNIKLTVYPDANHDAWTQTYNDPELYYWFLSHTRNER